MSDNTWVLASGNKGKIAEIARILSPWSLDLKPQGEFGVGSVEETGLTFVENALIKARHAAQVTGLPAIADDSGLSVAALEGAPGIYSARYAGPEASDADNNQKLLRALTDKGPEERQAAFICVIVALRHAADPVPLIAQAQWPGTIATTAAGEQGFGYDPLFWVPGHDCTSAQLPRDEKNRISHRGQALQQFASQLPQWLGSQA